MSLPVPLLLNSLLFLLATFPSSKDPYLTSQYAIQFVKGMQFGNDLRYALHYAWLAGTRVQTHTYIPSTGLYCMSFDWDWGRISCCDIKTRSLLCFYLQIKSCTIYFKNFAPVWHRYFKSAVCCKHFAAYGEYPSLLNHIPS